MASTQNEETVTFNAGADLSAAQYKLLKIDTAADGSPGTAGGQVVLQATLGGRVDAVLGNKPLQNQPAECVVEGQTKCLCGAAIASEGLELTADATSRAITAVSGNTVFAFSLAPTANAGEFVPIKIMGPYVKP